MDRIYLYLYLIFSKTIRFTPDFILKSSILLIANIAHFLDGRRKRIAKINLDFVYGDTLSQIQKIKIIKECYKNLARNLISFLKNQPKDEILNNVKFKNEECVKKLIEDGKQIIFVSAHYGNWEIVSLASACRLEINISIIGRKLGNEKLDEVLTSHREQSGIKMLDKNGALKHLIKALNEKKHIGILIDQNCADNEGILVDFFGKTTRHTHSASILAKRFNAPIVPIFITTKGFEKYEVQYGDPIFGDDIQVLTQKQANATESIIREKPEEWFWFHRRWKNQYEEIYPK